MRVLSGSKDIPQGCTLAIYGAGELGRRFHRHLSVERPDIGIACFVDSFVRGECAGLTCIGPEELKALGVDGVAIASGAVAQIGGTLDALGISNYFALDATYKSRINQKGQACFVRDMALLPATAALLVGALTETTALFALLAEEGRLFLAESVVTPESLQASAAGQGHGVAVVLGSKTWEMTQGTLQPHYARIFVVDDPRIGSRDDRLREEIGIQLEIWKGGYREGDPLSPLSPSKYGQYGWLSSLYVVYLTAIRPYIRPGVRALEIGCGGGAWSKAILKHEPAELWCVDVLSAEDTHFWEHVGQNAAVNYQQVEDFSCRALPDAYFDYFFSFGCFCHLSLEAVREYLANLTPTLKPGAEGFLMVADYNKYNKAVLEHHDSLVHLVPEALKERVREICSRTDQNFLDLNEDSIPRPGRWFHAGVERTCAVLESLGCSIVEQDMNVNMRDPLIHFRKKG